MIGNNSLAINQAQMIAAMQHYFETVLFTKDQCPLVTLVKENTGTAYEDKGAFTIATTTKKKEETK